MSAPDAAPAAGIDTGLRATDNGDGEGLILNALTKTSMRVALAELCQRDARLSQVVSDRGPPPLWSRAPGWRTLIQIILEQQVSLASGRAIYRRLAVDIAPLTAVKLSSCSIARLRRCGLTRQKAEYCHGVATAVVERRLNLAMVARQDDDHARDSLCAFKGIGPWTADVYLLMALRRPDIWPPGDLALIKSIEELYGVDDEDAITGLVQRWRPWRAVAARVLWHDYLGRRGRS